MLERIFGELGPWNWMVLGFALLALEILVPGVFLLWIGLAALDRRRAFADDLGREFLDLGDHRSWSSWCWR